MTDKQYKPFSEYRHKDYVTPRSMKEAYGHDPVLYTVEEEEEEEKDLAPLAWACVVVVLLLFAAYAVYVLFV